MSDKIYKMIRAKGQNKGLVISKKLFEAFGAPDPDKWEVKTIKRAIDEPARPSRRIPKRKRTGPSR